MHQHQPRIILQDSRALREFPVGDLGLHLLQDGVAVRLNGGVGPRSHDHADAGLGSGENPRARRQHLILLDRLTAHLHHTLHGKHLTQLGIGIDPGPPDHIKTVFQYFEGTNFRLGSLAQHQIGKSTRRLDGREHFGPKRNDLFHRGLETVCQIDFGGLDDLPHVGYIQP